METIKKNLPQIAIGTAAIAAIALGIYYYKQEGNKEPSPVPQKKPKFVIPKEMPVPKEVPLPLGVIDESKTYEEQLKDFQNWMN